MKIRVRALCCTTLLLALAAGARGASITVTTTADPAPAGCGLRDAIIAANTDLPTGGCPAGSGADVVDLSGVTGQISLGVGFAPPVAIPMISSTITIRGPGADRLTISGDGAVRIFFTYAFVDTVVIEGVTLADGSAASDAFDTGLGGCILAYGSLTLRDLRLTGCSGRGALNVASGTARLDRVLVDANRAEGISVGGVGGGGGIVIENTTVSGNDGIGLELVNADGPGPSARVYGSTFSDNGGTNLYVPIYAGEPGEFPLRLDHVVLANEAPGVNCGGQPVISMLANIANDASCNLDAPGDLVDVDPLIGPLADNGGPTATHALLPGSPAIDSGESGCPGFAGDRVFDQRGVARPQDGDGNGNARCDRGAFEVPEPAGAAAAALLALCVLRRCAGTRHRRF